ncbi:MAG TPA: hypothetical protein VN688_20290 [Gemmataceae bacterium]|nr:hypothetical protein [Gemmataceae bacterium]
MTLRSAASSLALLLAPCFVLMLLGRPASAQVCLHCPKTTFCRPKAPCIKYKCVCPKPICNGCDLENFGYYPTCWHPWPFPPNYSHCPVPPTSVMVPPGCGANPHEQLPTPQMLPHHPALQ